MEIWKPIPGCEGYYEVSSLGRVRSVDRISGKLRRFYKGQLLKLQLSTTGYPSFIIAMGKRIGHMKVNRAVCLAFHGPPPEGCTDTLHKDGVRTNNVPSNLRWGTRKQNMEDARRHGTIPRGVNRHNAVLDPDKVREIRRRKQDGETYRSLAAEFCVSIGCLQQLNERRTWAHVE